MRIVISGVNLNEGGPLRIYSDFLDSLAKSSLDSICLVNDRSLFKKNYPDNIKFIEISWPKKNWLNRIFFEYIYSYFVCLKLKPQMWVSLHDISPILPRNVSQFVYCHNPSPFYKPTLVDFKFAKKFFLFSIFYKYIYRFNIKSNTAVIFQQKWMSEEFKKNFHIDNVITCRPENHIYELDEKKITKNYLYNRSGKVKFFFPTLPRTFKNIELIIESVELDPSIQEISEFIITIDRSQGKYANYLIDRASKFDCFLFTGYLDRDNVESYYNNCDVVIFPSKLETWGLPITEAKLKEKPIIVSDLPYAYETIGNYDNVVFIPVNEPEHLAKIIRCIFSGSSVFNPIRRDYSSDILFGWDMLLEKITCMSDFESR
ncbi:glycosyltransferase [Pectobacterium punjabense]|uniref:glycosyltransferase n=1 Tax=Pectobacterium punjabense TaxID=2108399 RepID=UPI003D9B47E0